MWIWSPAKSMTPLPSMTRGWTGRGKSARPKNSRRDRGSREGLVWFHHCTYLWAMTPLHALNKKWTKSGFKQMKTFADWHWKHWAISIIHCLVCYWNALRNFNPCLDDALACTQAFNGNGSNLDNDEANNNHSHNLNLSNSITNHSAAATATFQHSYSPNLRASN